MYWPYLDKSVKIFLKLTNVFETGLPDFHKLTFTILISYFEKQKPKVINTEITKNLIAICLETIFWTNFYKKTFKPNIFIHLRLLLSIYCSDMHIKKKLVRCNQAAFVNKNLRKAIMKRSRLFNKCRKKRAISLYIAYKKQQNICVKILMLKV